MNEIEVILSIEEKNRENFYKNGGTSMYVCKEEKRVMELLDNIDEKINDINKKLREV